MPTIGPIDDFSLFLAGRRARANEKAALVPRSGLFDPTIGAEILVGFSSDQAPKT
jgi:hypothetical protein